MVDFDLAGRTTELTALRDRIHRLPSQGGALVVRGEPGIGKSSLLDAAARLAETVGHRALQATGFESEARIPFAGLHQFLRPVIHAADRLPATQRQALLSALGVDDGPSPELFKVALAVLNLLAELATERPVVVVVDDVHWLDQSSQDVLTFVARRVDRDAVLVVGAIRNGHASPFAGAGLPEFEVAALGDAAAREVLATRAADLSAADRDRILLEARGNPLALVELPEAWRTLGAAGRRAPLSTVPLTARLERAFAGRVGDLPGDARDAVLVAAVDYDNDLSEILAATSVLSGRPADVGVFHAPIQARLLTVDGTQVRFRHPLVRSAVLQEEPLARRLAANAALAKALDADPYRRTMHRAQSILGPDDEVADELEATHTISLRRGSVTSAVWALERSAQLTTDSATQGRRLLLAGEHAFGLGRADMVDRLITAAARTELTELDRARMEWLREIFSDGVPGDAGRVLELCEIAERSAAAGDFDLVLNLLLGAALRCWWADTGPQARTRVAAVAEALPVPATTPRRLAALSVAEPVLRGAVVHDVLTRMSPAGDYDADALRLLGMAAHAVGDAVRAVDLLSRSAQKLREEGRLGLLSHVLTMQINNYLWMGDWDRALVVSEEGHRIAADTGQPVWTTGSMSQEAIRFGLRGETERALKMAAQVEAEAGRDRLNDLLCCVQLARGLAWLSSGQYELSYEALRRLYDPADPSYHPRESFDGVMFFAEAAAHSGNRQDAAPVLAELERVARITPSPLLHIHLLYARAVLAEDADAEKLYATALGHDLSRWPLVRAKLELAYGEWLRRHRRAADSRTPLRSALTTLKLIGATAWAERARAELRASGERMSERQASALDELSPQQLEIARLAADGLSNKEIGERLYLSPRTVGSHLYRIFPILDITTRAQLAARLEER
ncbi:MULTISPECIES: AAA family ATPase [unclassified Streptomyces]|uniref:helix-turn-helix transcriptional regulator n=1 Tax=unclassified Streptomyces TaxID=2593676 RepID=UPI00371B546F